MKKILPITLAIILTIGLFIGVGFWLGADMGFLDLSNGCENDNNVVQEADSLEVFNGEFGFDVIETRAGVVKPTFASVLRTSELPDSYYISFNDDVKLLPEGSYTYTKYSDYFEVHIEGEILYDEINAGVQLATLYAHYKKGDKMRKVDETPVTIDEHLFRADYLGVDGMYFDSYSSEENVSVSFELVGETYVTPTLTLSTYLGELPSSVRVLLQGQELELSLSDFEVIDHDTYYELKLDKAIFFKTIDSGNDSLVIQFFRNDKVVREITAEFYAERDYYSTVSINLNTGERVQIMDSNDFWIGPF